MPTFRRQRYKKYTIYARKIKNISQYYYFSLSYGYIYIFCLPIKVECLPFSFSKLVRCLLFNSLPLFYVHYPNVIRFGSSFLCLLSRMLFGLSLSVLCSLSQMLFSSFPLFYAHYPRCYSDSFPLFYVHYSECYSLSFLLSHRSVLQLLL